jgi:hypothetical protein
LLRNRRLITVVCIVVLFAAAMAPLSSASICAVLVPLPILFGAVVSVRFAAPESVPFPSSCSTPPLPSRAPPLV